MVSLDFCISVVRAGKEMEGIKQKKKKKKKWQKKNAKSVCLIITEILFLIDSIHLSFII